VLTNWLDTQGTTVGKQFVIKENSLLTGHLPSNLPSLHYSVIAADISGNPLLCAGLPGTDFPVTWSINDNANADFCGCMVPVAQNYNPVATASDGSCIMTACDGCYSGTHGPCAMQIGGDSVCTEGLDLLEEGSTVAGYRCPAGTAQVHCCPICIVILLMAIVEFVFPQSCHSPGMILLAFATGFWPLFRADKSLCCMWHLLRQYLCFSALRISATTSYA